MRQILKAELARFRMTLHWSLSGWRAAWASEKSLRQWTLANAVSAGLALALDLGAAERALVIGFGLLVIAAELMNTAVEATVNRVGRAHHPLAKKAKDVASAAVAMTAIAAGVVWLCVLAG